MKREVSVPVSFSWSRPCPTVKKLDRSACSKLHVKLFNFTMRALSRRLLVQCCSSPTHRLVKGNANGARGRGFDSRAGQIEHSVAVGSPSLQCFFDAVTLWH